MRPVSIDRHPGHDIYAVITNSDRTFLPPPQADFARPDAPTWLRYRTTAGLVSTVPQLDSDKLEICLVRVFDGKVCRVAAAKGVAETGGSGAGMLDEEDEVPARRLAHLPPLRRFQLRSVRFGPLTVRTLRERLFDNVRVLDMARSPAFTSRMALGVLEGCVHLE